MGDYYAQALKFAEHYGDEMAKVNEPTASAIGAIALGDGDLASPASVLKTKAGSLLKESTEAKEKFAGSSEVSVSDSLFGGQVLAVATFATGVGLADDPTTGGDGEPKQGDPKQGEPKSEAGKGTAAKFEGFGKNNAKLITMLAKAPEVSEGTLTTMSLGEVQKLCDEVIKLSDSIASYRKDWEMADVLKVKPENVIQTWLSYEGGFEDMLCTMYILFGKRTKFIRSPRKDS